MLTGKTIDIGTSWYNNYYHNYLVIITINSRKIERQQANRRADPENVDIERILHGGYLEYGGIS